MTFDTRGGSRTISKVSGAAAKMAAQRYSGIMYTVRLNRSRTVWWTKLPPLGGTISVNLLKSLTD